MNAIEVRDLQHRVRELERQLVEARAKISALEASRQQPEGWPAYEQVKADHARLLANEERWQSVLRLAPCPLMILREDGKVLLINETWTDLTGYTLEDIPTFGEWARKVHGGHALTTQSLTLEEGFLDEAIRHWGEFEIRIRSRGQRIWDFSAAPLGVDESGRRWVVVMGVDVTDRKRAEEAARFSGGKFARAFQSNPVAMTITSEEDGRYLDVNQAFCELVEYDRSEIIGRTSVDLRFFTEVERKEVTGQLQAAGTVRQKEFTITTKTGARRLVLVSLQQTEVNEEAAILGTILDISERKRVEEALRESEERYRRLFEQMQEGLVVAEVITDDKGKPVDYRYLDVNPATERQFGIPREDFFGRTYTEVLPEGDREWIDIFGKVALTGEPVTVERYGRASGRWFECHVYSPRRGQVVNIVTDITERKRAEDALRKSEERFAKAFHAGPDAIIISRMSDGLIIEVNDGWTALFGHAPQEVIGRTSVGLELFANPEDRKEAIRRLQEKGHVRDFELQVRQKSGDLRLANLSAEKLEINGEACLLTVLRDVTDHRRAEDALRKSEERFAKAFRASPDAIVISRLSDDLIMEVNEGWKTLLGHERHEVIGRTSLELGMYVNLDDRQAVLKRLQEAGRLRDFEVEVRRKSGEIRQASLSAERIEISETECLLVVVRDITDRKQAERELRESEERFSKAFRRAPFGMHITRWQDGVLLDVNDAWLKMFGWTRNEALGKSTAELNCYVRPADRDRIRSLIVEDEALGDMELHVRRKDGSEFFITAATTLIDLQGERCILSVVNDITEQKRTEQALRESEARFHSLADSMPQLVWTALPDGTVDYYNERYREYSEITHLADNAWEWAPVLHSDDLQLTLDAWRRAVATGEMYQAEHRVRMVDGSYRWHLSRGVPVRDERGHVTRWFGTATDIHELRQALKKLDDYARRLERSNRDLQEFAYVASHDLQEPLRKVEAFGSALYETSADLSEKQRDYIERMRNAAGRMRSMVDGLLALSRVGRATEPFTRVDLQQIASEVVSVLDAQMKRTQGRVEILSLPEIDADPLQMHQLLQNLIGNALKFHRREIPPQVRVYARRAGTSVELIVEDNGIGFHEEDAERIFHPFQRLVGRSEYEGSGMGLAICRKIVERHNGTLTAEANVGQGSTFVVRLPAHQSMEPHRG